jgi:hypothetical protein
MSSPDKRRSNRSSVNGTPRRSARSSQAPASSPTLPNNGNAAADEQLRAEASDADMQDVNVTPRGNTRSSQNISQSQAPPTSSPLFFRSSPNGSQSQSQQGGRAGGAGLPFNSQADVPSSDGGRTPRASGGMGMGGGRSCGLTNTAYFWTNAIQILLRSIMLPALIPPVLMHAVLIGRAPVACSFGLLCEARPML